MGNVTNIGLLVLDQGILHSYKLSRLESSDRNVRWWLDVVHIEHQHEQIFNDVKVMK